MVTASGTTVSPPPEKKKKAKPKKNKAPREPKQKRLSRAALEFQPDAVEIERRSVPGRARWTLYVVIALIISAVVWATMTKVDKIVVAQGKLVTTNTPVIVQSNEQSPIKEVRHKFGDIVRRGDTLAILDTSFPESELRRISKELLSVNAKLERLNAEIFDRPYSVDPEDEIERVREFHLYQARNAAKDANIAELDHQIDRTIASESTNTGMIAMYETQQTMLDEQILRMEGLIDRGLGTADELIRLQDSLLISQIRSREYELRQDELVAERDGLQKRKEAFLFDWQKQLLEELTEIDSKRVDLEEQQAKTNVMLERSILRVPMNLEHEFYMITEAAERTSDSVVQPGEAVFKLIPVDSPLEVEVSISGKDIGTVFLDDQVKIKFNAFPFQKYGTAAGLVRTISEESARPQAPDPEANEVEQANEATTFRAIVEMDENWREGLEINDSTRFYPGMTVVAEINVGKRRVIDYFLYPIWRTLDRSIREP